LERMVAMVISGSDTYRDERLANGDVESRFAYLRETIGAGACTWTRDGHPSREPEEESVVIKPRARRDGDLTSRYGIWQHSLSSNGGFK